MTWDILEDSSLQEEFPVWTGDMKAEFLQRRRSPPGGFTLIELIVTLGILVIVLGMAYRILDNCLRTERYIERVTLPEKIGQAIISLLRRDLEGAVYRNLGTDRVFQVIDNGGGEIARDEIQLYTTVEPTPLEDLESQRFDSGGFNELNQRTITAVSYYLKENQHGVYTLFRRESFGEEIDPFEGGRGFSYEIYDKVKSFSVLCFDAEEYEMGAGMPWVESWESSQRILLAQEAEEAAMAAQAGIPMVGRDQSAEDYGESLLPPAAIPTAVFVEVSIFVGDERGLFKDQSGRVLPPKTYSAVIPLLAAQRIPLYDESDVDPGIPNVGKQPDRGDQSQPPPIFQNQPLTPGQ